MHFLDLRVAGESLIPEQITELFGLTPDTAYKKGDINFYRNKEIVYSEGCWIKGIEIPDCQNISKLISNFINEILSCSDKIKTLSEQFNITLWLTIYPDTEQMNLHFLSQTIRDINKLGITLDISIMSLQAFYDGSYLEYPK